VAGLVAADGEARALLTELTNTKAAVAGYEADIRVPVARDFYWSGIRREIERQESRKPAAPEQTSIFALLRRMVLPAGGLVAVMLAVMFASQSLRSGPVTAEFSETTFTDAGAFTYQDHASGTTLVWVDYPAENEFAQLNLDDILELY
jgi:hypothetical protein